MKFLKKIFAPNKAKAVFGGCDENENNRLYAEKELEENISRLKARFAQNPPSLDRGEGYAIMRGYKYLSEGISESEKKKLDGEFARGEIDRNYEMSLHFYKELAEFISALNKP